MAAPAAPRAHDCLRPQPTVSRRQRLEESVSSWAAARWGSWIAAPVTPGRSSWDEPSENIINGATAHLDHWRRDFTSGPGPGRSGLLDRRLIIVVIAQMPSLSAVYPSHDGFIIVLGNVIIRHDEIGKVGHFCLSCAPEMPDEDSLPSWRDGACTVRGEEVPESSRKPAMHSS